ncbi:MAG: hypothetical protein ACRC7R_01450 [Sarcina sp.]
MAKLKVTSTPTKLGKELLSQAKQGSKVSFRVGVFGSDDSTQVKKAASHEFGAEIKVTKKMRGYFMAKFGVPLKVGSIIKIPARKWLTLAFERNRDYFNQLIKANVKKVAEGRMTVEESNNIIAITLAEVTKEELGQDMNNPPIKYRKGTPLVDTGDMRRSIGTKIVSRKGVSKTHGYGDD